MTTRTHLILPIVAAVLTVSGLAGCTGSPSSGPSTSDGSTRAAGGASAPLPTIPTGTGIISGTTLTGCDTTGSDVTATGTVTMPEGDAGDVVVSVSWVNSKTSSVYGRGVTTLKDLKGGDKKEWTTSATLPAGAESVSCVLGAVVPR